MKDWYDENDYRAYVGPPNTYDYMSGLIFKTMFEAGLREHHRLLDIGCGSLRAGRLLIPYLGKKKYVGVEPNTEILDKGIAANTGAQLLSLKEAVIYYDTYALETNAENNKFDYILAHSIFTHTAKDVFDAWLDICKKLLDANGQVIATVYIGKEDHKTNGWEKHGWIYPDCVSFSNDQLDIIFKRHKFIYAVQKWPHPSQRWLKIFHA